MTGNIAHELRTPVTSILGYLEIMLENDLPNDKKLYYLQRAYKQSKNLSELITNVGLLSKIEHSEASNIREKVKLNAVIAEVLQDLEKQVAEKHIRMDNRIAAACVKGNEMLLYAIFRNLLENAVRYAGEGQTVVIKPYNTTNDRLYISFANTSNAQLSDAQIAQLFDRFYRVSEGRTRLSGGSGLGLSIVKNAVEWHGGSIVARRLEGGGLEFIFDFECAPYEE